MSPLFIYYRHKIAQRRKLHKVLKPGFEPFNWNSLHIPTFYESCNSAINEFQNTVSRVKKSAASIEDVITSISSMALVRLSDFPDDISFEIAELYEKIEENRVLR